MISNVAFRRSFVIARGRLDTVTAVVDEIPVKVRCPIVLQEFLNYALRVAVRAFSEMLVTDSSLGIDNVERWPELIIKALPDPVVAVHHDWIGNVQVAKRRFHICLLLFE